MLCAHFGHCEEFMVYEVNDGKVVSKKSINPPAHAPGVIPQFLAKEKINYVLAGGMGAKAKSIFDSHGIEVITGVMESDLDKIVDAYLNNNLCTGENACDH